MHHDSRQTVIYLCKQSEFICKIFLPMEQVSPQYPGEQVHVNESDQDIQVPSFSQGFGIHG